jgi:predicted RNase H-like HicB family nuclease
MGLAETHNLDLHAVGPLTFAYYDEPDCEGVLGAHCLELDVAAQGPTREGARKELQAALETYLLHFLESGDPVPLRSAPDEIQACQDREVFHVYFVRYKLHREHRKEIHFAPPPPQRFCVSMPLV